MVFLRMGFGSKIGISSAFGEDEESKGEGSVNGNFNWDLWYEMKYSGLSKPSWDDFK